MLTLGPDKILSVVLFLVVPGIVVNRVYALKCPGPKPDWDKSVLEFGTYSIFNLLIWSWAVWPYFSKPFDEWTPWKFTITGLFVSFISPAILALTWRWLRVKYLHHVFGVDHPTPRGWDFFLANGGGEFFVLFHLKGGRKMGGYFGGRSLASTFPQDPELYVEQVWRLDEIGRFEEPVPGSAGAVVRQAEWDLIEFFKVEREYANGSGQDQEGLCGEGEGSSDESTGRNPGIQPPGPNGQTNGQDHPAKRWIGDSPTAESQKTQIVGS